MRRAAVLVALAAVSARAEGVVPGAPDGAEVTVTRARAYETYALPTGPVRLDGAGTQDVTGRVSWAAYRLENAGATTAGVMSAYRDRLAGSGFEILYDCRGEACGGFDFRFGVSILPPPAMLMDVQDFAQLSVMRAEPEVYASILASRVHDRVFVQTVTVVPAETPVEVTEAPAPAAAEETVLLPQDERAILDRLTSDGHVPVDGLAFEPGGATLSAGSDETLDLLARILTRDAELSVAIVGHSDNAGGLAPNIALSQRRAEAVMQALIRRGVTAGQLEARGIGYLAPLTSNATEEGRARNRRVELVLR